MKKKLLLGYIFICALNPLSYAKEGAFKEGKILFADGSPVAGAKLKATNVEETPIKGQVKGEDGIGLPGVSVVVKGTTIGTTTDVDGKYSLNVPEGSATLVFSFIGYTNEEVAINNRTSIDISLAPDIKALSEVVVVGYGTQKKSSVTGAISSISSKELSLQPVVNVSQALQGRVAGVTVVNNGSPGSAPIVRVRGVGTINNANPLYVIDGFPTGDLNSFDPKDIESIEVLKDASSAAIYGSRAANGVVLITTKRGANKKISVNIDSYYGYEQAWKKLDLLKREDYIAYAKDIQQNAGAAVPARIVSGMNQPLNSQTTQTYAQTETDWQDEMFRNGAIQQHKIDILGGNEKSKIFTSASYFKQEGIMIGTGYERGSVRLNSDHNISKRITFGNSFFVSFDDAKLEQQSGGRTQLQHIVRSMPYLPVRNPDNLGGFAGAAGVDVGDPENPVRIALMDKQNQQRMKLLGNMYVDIKIFDFLSYRFQGGVDNVNFTQRTHQPAYSAGTAERKEVTTAQTRFSNNSIILTNQLSFNKTFGSHTISATAVAERQTFTFSQIFGSGQNGQANQIKEPASLNNQTFNGNRNESALISYIGRVNYDFANKYLIGASFRRDGSSRFGSGNKWGSFPAVSAGWRLSQEGFLKNSRIINELKLRGSYGLTGNNFLGQGAGGDYAYQTTLTGNQYYEFDKTSSTLSGGYVIRTMSNSDVQWESTEMTDIGLDLGLFNNQITLTADYFNNVTKDMLISVQLPTSTGYDNSPIANLGSVRNRGFEFLLGYNKTVRDFQFNATGNLSVVRNKVLSIGTPNATITSGQELGYGDFLTMTKAGSPMAYFNGYVTDGIFQNQAEVDAHVGSDGKLLQSSAKPGDIRFKDINDDGALNDDDKQNIGHFLPDFSYGFNLSANWKGIDAAMHFQGVYGNEIYSVMKYDLEGMSRLFNAGAAVKDRWTHEGQNTDVPRAVTGDPNKNVRASDRFIEDGSYLRLKNLTIGYSLPSNLLNSFGEGNLTKVRVYFTSQNLLTFTKYKGGYDPEIGNRNSNAATTGGGGGSLSQGIDFGQFPQARSLVLGLQIGF